METEFDPIYYVGSRWSIHIGHPEKARCERCGCKITGAAYTLSLRPYFDERSFCMLCVPRNSDITNDEIEKKLYKIQELIELVSTSADPDRKPTRWLYLIAYSCYVRAHNALEDLRKSDVFRHGRMVAGVEKWVYVLKSACDAIADEYKFHNDDVRSMLTDILLPASRTLTMETEQ